MHDRTLTSCKADKEWAARIIVITWYMLFFLIYSDCADQSQGEKWTNIKPDIYHVPGTVPKKLPCKITEMPNHIPFIFPHVFTSHSSFI